MALDLAKPRWQAPEWSANIVAQKEVDFPNFWCSDLQYITSALPIRARIVKFEVRKVKPHFYIPD